MAGPTFTFEDLRTSGILWALNRHVFHPRGLALGLDYPVGASVADIEAHHHQPIGFQIYGDGSEPWQYDKTCDDAGFESFCLFIERLMGRP